ncbi:hypothetical protein EV361DRAFT_952711 [Lentinula raphanica]|nr:hypothetical protein EV361DRAFT_952711 [Lentinula raphanica]
MDEEMDFSTFYKHMLSPLVVKVILETLFYGILLVLFSVCMAIHRRQHYAARRTLQKTGLICLFILATATTSLDTTAAMRQMWLYLGKDWGGQTSLDEESISRLTVQLDVICGTLVFGLYIVSNFTADLMLIYRNSVFWSGSNRQWMIWLPLSISVFSNALGIVGIALEASDISLYPSLSVPFDQYTNGDKIILAYLFINVCLNLVITGCLAGRVWWISRKTVLSVGEHPLKRTYNSVVAITLESGILYPIALVGSVGATLQNSTAPNLYPFLIQAIAPTLIVVRTVLGISIEQDTDSYEEISAETTTFTRNEGADYMRTKTPPPPFDPYPNGNFAPTSFSATVVSKGKAGRTLTYNPCTN